MKYYTTKQLKKFVGSSEKKLVYVSQKTEFDLDENAISHGIVFGDGTFRKSKTGIDGKCFVCLVGTTDYRNKRKLSKYFKNYSLIERDDIGQTRIYSLPGNWKTLPDIYSSSFEYIRGFIAGWFATDGHIDKNGNCSICSNSKEEIEWLQTASSKAGISVSTNIMTFEYSENTFGNGEYYVISINKDSVNENFFVSDFQRSRYIETKCLKYWKIVTVEETELIEDVYCLEVESGNEFVLEGNILTHNCSIYYSNDEILDVANWLYANQNIIGGLSFLPKFDASYPQAPYIEISKAEYETLLSEFPEIDFSLLQMYEDEDLTTMAGEVACSAGACDFQL